jgi:hypothetical protein
MVETEGEIGTAEVPGPISFHITTSRENRIPLFKLDRRVKDQMRTWTLT